MIHQVPGGTVNIRDKVTVYGRELLQEAGFGLLNLLKDLPSDMDVKKISDIRDVPAELLSPELIRSFNQLNRAGIVAYVSAWSFSVPTPTMDTIGDMDTDLYDSVAKIVAPMVLRGMFGEDFSMAGATDPKAPTGNLPDSMNGQTVPSPPSASPAPVPSNSIESIGSVEPSGV